VASFEDVAFTKVMRSSIKPWRYTFFMTQDKRRLASSVDVAFTVKNPSPLQQTESQSQT
jgi:hypothetical protein